MHSISINLKGTKKDKMPVKSKKRSMKISYRGLSHHKICIISAIDENDKHDDDHQSWAESSWEVSWMCNALQGNGSDSLWFKIMYKAISHVIGAINENIPVYGGQKRYKTPAGRSLGSAWTRWWRIWSTLYQEREASVQDILMITCHLIYSERSWDILSNAKDMRLRLWEAYSFIPDH